MRKSDSPMCKPSELTSINSEMNSGLSETPKPPQEAPPNSLKSKEFAKTLPATSPPSVKKKERLPPELFIKDPPKEPFSLELNSHEPSDEI
jgi:hypothetical protein